MQTKLANHRPARQKSRRPTTIRRRRIDFEALGAPSRPAERAGVNAREDRSGAQNRAADQPGHASGRDECALGRCACLCHWTPQTTRVHQDRAVEDR